MKIHEPNIITTTGGEVEIPILLSEQEISSAVSSVDFSDFRDDTRFNTYLLVLDGVSAETDDVNLQMRLSEDNGATFDAGGTDYGFIGETSDDGTADGQASDGTTQIALTGNTHTLGTTAGERWSGTILLFPGFGSGIPVCYIRGAWLRAPNNVGSNSWLGAVRLSLGYQADGISIFTSSGNINSGQFRLYGLR